MAMKAVWSMAALAASWAAAGAEVPAGCDDLDGGSCEADVASLARIASTVSTGNARRSGAEASEASSGVEGFTSFPGTVFSGAKGIHRRGLDGEKVCARYCLDLPGCQGFMLHKSSDGCFTFDDLSNAGNQINGAHDSYKKFPCKAGDECLWLVEPEPPSLYRDTTTEGGAPWTEDEALIVMAKVYAITTGTQGLEQLKETLECYVEGPDSNETNPTRIPCIQHTNRYEGFGVDPSFRSLLRMGFHTCMKYKDGTGGCDGCLNFAGIFDLWHVGQKGRPGAGKPGGVRANAGLQLLMDALEQIYIDPKFPGSSPTLPVSLRQSGKSRADLWAFAALVGAYQLQARNNQVCEIGEGLYNTMPQVAVECKIRLDTPMRFATGRRDCGQDNRPPKPTCLMQCYKGYGKGLKTLPGCRPGMYSCDVDDTCKLEQCNGCRWCKPRVDGGHWPRAYESKKEEDDPAIFFDGKMTADYFRRTFDFNARETVAILGAHSAGEWHPPVNGGIPYDMIHKQTDTLNNVYFRVISDRKSNHFERGDDFAAVSVGGVGTGKAAELSHRHIQNANSGREPDAPDQWASGYLRCPFCLEGHNVDRHQNIWGSPVTRCCELCPKATHAEVVSTTGDMHVYKLEGLTQQEESDFTRHQCLKYVNVHEVMLQSDVSLFWNITIPQGFYRSSLSQSPHTATCTCPDGSTFAVGGLGKCCGTATNCKNDVQWACEGGVVSDECRLRKTGETPGMKVNCGGRGYAQNGPGKNDGQPITIKTMTPGPFNNHKDPEDTLSMHGIVYLYADNQAAWATAFARTMEKMLRNGVKQTLTESFSLGADIRCTSRPTWTCKRSPRATCADFSHHLSFTGFTCPFRHIDIAGKDKVQCAGVECTVKECCKVDLSQKMLLPKPPANIPVGFVYLGTGICMTTFNSPHHFNMKNDGNQEKCAELCRQDAGCWAFSTAGDSCGRFARDSLLGDCGQGFRAKASRQEGVGIFSFGKVSVKEAKDSDVTPEIDMNQRT